MSKEMKRWPHVQRSNSVVSGVKRGNKHRNVGTHHHMVQISSKCETI